MTTKGIRGAITVDNNTEKDLKDATLTLLKEMIDKNNIEVDKISHVLFTTTKDINIQFPAKYAREELNWSKVAMMCYNELDVPNALAMCLRILIVYNCDKDFSPKFVYLKGAENLRK